MIDNGYIQHREFVTSSSDQVGLTLALAGSANWAVDTIHDVFAFLNAGVMMLGTRLWDADMYPTETLITPVSAITTGTGANAWTTPGNAFDGVTNQAMASSARIAAPSNAGLANCLGQAWGADKTVSSFVVVASNNNTLFGSGAGDYQINLQGSPDGVNWTSLGFYYLDASANGTSYTIPVNVGNQVPYAYHRVRFSGNVSYSINVAELQFFERNPALAGRRLTRLAGILVNDASMTCRTGAASTVTVPQYAGTYLGTIRIDRSAAGRITAHNFYGPSRVYNVWNAHNQMPIVMRGGVITNASSYVVSNVRWQLAQVGFQIGILRGLSECAANISLFRTGYLDCLSARKSYEFGIGIDSQAVFSGVQGGLTLDTAGQQMSFGVTARATIPAGYPAGYNIAYGIERVDSGGGVANAFPEQRSTVLEAEWKG